MLIQQVHTLEGTTPPTRLGRTSLPRLMRNRPLIGDRVTQNKIQGGLGNCLPVPFTSLAG